MDTSPWFDDVPVIGELPPEQAVAMLREIGEDDTADMLEMAQEAESKTFGFGIPKSWSPFVDKPWKHTTHEFGYLAPAQLGSDHPIFIGLGVGDEGLLFRCRTINVQNDQDEDFLNILESNVFKDGLHLINTVQPAIAPFSAIAYGLAEKIAKRNRNVSVQDFDLGLDFNNISMDGRLAERSYLAVQVPENQQPHWNWQD